MILKILGMTMVVLLLSGCGVAKLAPMKKNIQSELGTIDTTLIIQQSNLDISVTNTDASSAGLLGVLVGAIIDSARRSSAEEEGLPLLESLKDYDFREVMLSETTSSFSKLKNVNINVPIKVDEIGSTLSLRMGYDKITSNALLLCNISYKMVSGNLITTLHASLYPKAEKLKQLNSKYDESNPLADENVLYNNKFTFVKEGITSDNIINALNEAANNLAIQLSSDIDYGI